MGQTLGERAGQGAHHTCMARIPFLGTRAADWQLSAQLRHLEPPLGNLLNFKDEQIQCLWGGPLGYGIPQNFIFQSGAPHKVFLGEQGKLQLSLRAVDDRTGSPEAKGAS